MRSVAPVWLVVAPMLLLTGVARSQTADSAAVLPVRPHSEAPVLHAVPLAGSVHVDGHLDDAAIAATGNQDTSWDPVWNAQTSIDSLGWTVEMEIPLSQLHYSGSNDAVWGVQIRRWINRKQELSEFSFTPLKEAADVSRY